MITLCTPEALTFRKSAVTVYTNLIVSAVRRSIGAYHSSRKAWPAAVTAIPGVETLQRTQPPRTQPRRYAESVNVLWCAQRSFCPIVSLSTQRCCLQWQEVCRRPSRDPRHTTSQHQHSNTAYRQPQALTTRQCQTSSRPQSPARWSSDSSTHAPIERRQHSSASGAPPFRNQPDVAQQSLISGHAQDTSQAHWGQGAAVRGQSQGYSVSYRGQLPPSKGQIRGNSMPYRVQHMPANAQPQDHTDSHRWQQSANTGHAQNNASIFRQSSASRPNTPQLKPGSMSIQHTRSTISSPVHRPANATLGKPVMPFRPSCQEQAIKRPPGMLQYTVQLVPDLSSITLLNSSHAAFVGKPPPAHHNYTAINDFLEHIRPGLGRSFADVWLDTAHITFANIQLPTDKVCSFSSAFTQKVAELPALTSGCYNITDLKHFKKASRRDISTKGSSFYYMDLDSTTSDFQDTQELWVQALQQTVRELGGKCNDIRRNREQHMTVRSFSLRTAAGSFEQLAKALRANPATVRCAGIRVQQSVDQALETGNKQALIVHAYFHKLLARYPVPLYISCEAASHAIVLADKQRRLQRRDAAALEAAVNDVLDCLSLST